MKKLTGLIAAPHTPFTVDNKVNFGAIDQIAELLISQGVKGAY
nr:N-acetylneuraminate lyase [Vibrio anguillarum]